MCRLCLTASHRSNKSSPTSQRSASGLSPGPWENYILSALQILICKMGQSPSSDDFLYPKQQTFSVS